MEKNWSEEGKYLESRWKKVIEKKENRRKLRACQGLYALLETVLFLKVPVWCGTMDLCSHSGTNLRVFLFLSLYKMISLKTIATDVVQGHSSMYSFSLAHQGVEC
jgi:hypothetical protein